MNLIIAVSIYGNSHNGVTRTCILDHQRLMKALPNQKYVQITQLIGERRYTPNKIDFIIMCRQSNINK